MLDELNAKLLDKKGEDELYGFKMDEVDIKVLKLKDSSSDEIYFIGVPFKIESVIQGKIWISGHEPEEYEDLVVDQET